MRIVALAAWIGLAVAGACAGEETEGIAAKYPGDAGIETDEHVLLHENFESGTLDRQKWTDIKGAPRDPSAALGMTEVPGALSFSDDVAEASAGKKSLLVTATLGANTGGHLFRRFEQGVEKMHARWYVRFAPDCDYIHHFVHIVAELPATRWPTGGAGELPAGDKKFSTGLEPAGRWGKHAPPGAWNFYSYWWKMKRSGDGKYWGNSFMPDPPVVPERGRWYAMEMMIQANTPGKADGRQAFWVDGRKVGDFGGIEWRATPNLKINAFWLMSYITEHSVKTNKVNRVWFDDVVVATDYIGPIRPKDSAKSGVTDRPLAPSVLQAGGPL